MNQASEQLCTTAIEENHMFKRILIISAITLAATPLAFASDHEDDVARTHKAAQFFQEIMDTPDKSIPHDLLKSARCIAIIPGDKKFAFIFGGATVAALPLVARRPDGVLRSLLPSTAAASGTRLEAHLRTWSCFYE
jgi:lipid-binding SYLF domain-containing protein